MKPLEWFPIGKDEKGYQAAYKITGGFFLWITNFKNSDFIDGISHGGAATFLEFASEADITLYI